MSEDCGCGLNSTGERVNAAPPPTVLDRAAVAVAARQAVYGPPSEHWQRTAGVWSAYLGIPISIRDVALLYVLDKVSRLAHSDHQDSWDDICGYARAYETTL